MNSLQQILQMGQQMQSRVNEIQDRLGKEEISASSGGGMVTVVVDGKGGIRRLSIDPGVVDPQDVEMLEDLVTAAVAEAQEKAKGRYEEEMQKLAGGIPLPFKLPGLF